jgi:RNA polymerase sigma-70 factor (ECF subfamily)
MTVDESVLVAGLQAGDGLAFETIVKTYSSRLVATAARMLGSESDAQDVVQETMVAAWKNAGQFEARSSLYTWLHRITVNGCLARLRSMRSKTEVSISSNAQPVSVAFEGLPTAWSEPGPDLHARLAMRRALQKALAQIPEEFRTVLLLRDVEELSSREVAERLGIPDATVRQRLHRARTAMAELLRPELCEGDEIVCGGDLDLLMDYIDRSLPAELQTPVHNHIEGCPGCTDLLHIYRETMGIPRAIAELTATNELSGDWVAQTLAMATGQS